MRQALTHTDASLSFNHNKLHLRCKAKLKPKIGESDPFYS